MKPQNRKKVRKRDFRPGCLFWIALILLVITVFIVNHKRIQNVVEATGFLNLFSKSNQEQEATQPNVVRIVETPGNGGARQQTTPATEPQRTEVALPETQTGSNVIVNRDAVLDTERGSESIAQPYRVRDSILYFIAITEDGSIHLRKTTRSIRFADSPLTATMNSLLSGVSSLELNNNHISLIPENTRLNRLWVVDGTAYMDFNENFLFNSFGREGYIGQLQQIIYSATEFPTVNRVQILIAGRTMNYLGATGIYIGKPLTRASF
ncbi:MAG: GerMN domain-containing protein [Spirochaetaceae bacterium]|nr:GerMN domain-containing protein [Spirochaetaceae bacterium]